MQRRELDEYLRRFLEVENYDDEAVNGLQVEGREEVRRIAFGVSACAEVFRKAAAAKADALVVHHGLLWKGSGPEPITGMLRSRLGILFDAGASLFAYHLPLDAHGEVGNNAVAARALGLQELNPFCDYHGQLIGWEGSFPESLSTREFVNRLEAYYGHRAHVVEGGPARVRRVGIVSGGAAKEAREAAALGLDAYVTGEPGEPATYLARESGLTFAAMGHYATERVGVQALARHLEGRFGVETLFIEVENEA
jgi:dinuclear metal center YbgI/SA1388 family protein